MSFIGGIGLLAASLTTLSALPQVVRCWRRRSPADLSLGTFLMAAGGISLWLLYGLLIHDVPLIAGNAVSLVFVGSILAMKLRWG